MPAADDATLVQQSLNGDREAFAALVERYQSALFRLAFAMAGNREDAEDLCQECFLHLYRVLPKYNPRCRFSTWFKRVATNLFINEIKGIRRRATPIAYIEDIAESPHEPVDYSANPEEETFRRDEAKRILAAVNMLPTELRIPMTLRYLEDLSFKEIAEILDLPIGTVSTRIRRGTELVRRAIHAGDNE